MSRDRLKKMFESIKGLFKKKELSVQEELNKIMKRVNDAYVKYEKNPNVANTYYLDGLLDITERLVFNLEKIYERPSIESVAT